MRFPQHKIYITFAILIVSIITSANYNIATGVGRDRPERKSIHYNNMDEMMGENPNLNIENETDQMFQPSFLLTTDEYINNRQGRQRKDTEHNNVPSEGIVHLFFPHSADRVVNTNVDQRNWQQSKKTQSMESRSHFELPYQEKEINKSLFKLSTDTTDKGNYIFINHNYDYNPSGHSDSHIHQQEAYGAPNDSIDGDYTSIKEETHYKNAAEGEMIDQLEFALNVTDPTSDMDTFTYTPLRTTARENENSENNESLNQQVKFDRYGHSGKRFHDYHNRYDTYYDTELTDPDDISIPHTYKHLPMHPYYAPKPTSQFDWTHLGILALVKLAVVKFKALGLMKLAMILLLKFPFVLIMFGLKLLVLVKVVKLATLPLFLLVLAPLLLLPLLLGPLLFLPLLLPLLLLLPIPVLSPVTTTTPSPVTASVPAAGRKRRSTDPDDDILQLVRNILLAEECLERIACQLAANGGQPSYITWLLEKTSQLTNNRRFDSYVAAYKVGRTLPDSCSPRYPCLNS